MVQNLGIPMWRVCPYPASTCLTATHRTFVNHIHVIGNICVRGLPPHGTAVACARSSARPKYQETIVSQWRVKPADLRRATQPIIRSAKRGPRVTFNVLPAPMAP